jgi:hypothetical protein
MDVVPGTSRPAPEETEATAPEYLSFVARVHAADPASFPIEQFATMGDALRDELGWWTTYADESGATREPLVRLAARILATTLPASDERPSLVHGDAGAGNFIVEHGRVTALLDWELAHVGDPHEDMAWLWMRGAHTSFGDPVQRLAEYEAAAGWSIDFGRLRWHLALVMWKSCVGMYADLQRPPTAGALVQSMVILTYDALLGSQLRDCSAARSTSSVRSRYVGSRRRPSRPTGCWSRRSFPRSRASSSCTSASLPRRGTGSAPPSTTTCARGLPGRSELLANFDLVT